MSNVDKKPEGEQPDDEKKDSVEGVEGKEKPEDVIPEAEKAMNQLQSAYEKNNFADGLVDMIEEDIDQSTARIEELRAQIGVEDGESDDVSPANEEKLEALAIEQEELKVKMEELEKMALELPPDLNGEEQESDPFQTLQKVEEFADSFEENMEMDEKTEAELKEMRKQAVEKFIKDSTESVLDHFDSLLNECENTDRAKKIIELKTQSTVMKAAQKRIETGEYVDLSFVACLKTIEHESPEGETVKFVTEYDVTIDGKKEDIGLGESIEGEGLLDKNEDGAEDLEDELEQAKRDGEEKKNSE